MPAGKGEIQISVFLVFFVDFLFVLSTGLNLCLLTSGKQGSSFFDKMGQPRLGHLFLKKKAREHHHLF